MKPALYLPLALLMACAPSAPAQSRTDAAQKQNAQGNSSQGASAPAGQNAGQPDSLEAEAARVQAEVVSLPSEPHHRLVLQNEYARVYNVSVPPLDATLVHRHDLPYLAVSLGATNIENDVTGKGAVRLKLEDGQVTYSPGGFTHFVRTDAGMAFNNVTVELSKPQGTARNLCKEIVAGPLGDCRQEQIAAAAGKKASTDNGDDDIPYFETDEVRVDVVKVSSGKDYVDANPKLDGLLVAMSNANLDANLGGEHVSFLHDGDILWMPAGTHRKVVDFLGTRSTFLLVSFKKP